VVAGAESEAGVKEEADVAGGERVISLKPNGNPVEVLRGPGAEMGLVGFAPVAVVEGGFAGLGGKSGERGTEASPGGAGGGEVVKVSEELIRGIGHALDEAPGAAIELIEPFFERIEGGWEIGAEFNHDGKLLATWTAEPKIGGRFRARLPSD
jgi:hypothetical protein